MIKKIVPILIIVRNTINTNSGNLLKLFPLKSLNAKIAHQEHNKVDSQVSSSNEQLLKLKVSNLIDVVNPNISLKMLEKN